MKILVIADVESKSLWDYFHPKKLEGIELIISCGDLNPKYLSFLATFFHGDVLYVHGNHDEIYESDPPLGAFLWKTGSLYTKDQNYGSGRIH